MPTAIENYNLAQDPDFRKKIRSLMLKGARLVSGEPNTKVYTGFTGTEIILENDFWLENISLEGSISGVITSYTPVFALNETTNLKELTITLDTEITQAEDITLTYGASRPTVYVKKRANAANFIIYQQTNALDILSHLCTAGGDLTDQSTDNSIQGQLKEVFDDFAGIIYNENP